MSIADALAGASAKAAGTRPYFYSPEVERVLAITLAVAQELAVARQRLDTLERILERHGHVVRAEIESFAPTVQESAERGSWNQEYVARIFRILQQEAEAVKAAQAGDPSVEDYKDRLAAEKI